MGFAGYKDSAPTALGLIPLPILFRVIAQNQRSRSFHFRCRTGHGLWHRVRAKINATGFYWARAIP